MYDTLAGLSDETWREESARYPRDYGGYWPGDDGYLRVGIGQSRDSDTLEASNYIAAFNALTETARELDPDGEPEGGWVLEHRASHWAVGWVESLWIADVEELRDAVRDLWAALMHYPVLDEDDYSEREHGEWLETVEACTDDMCRDLERDGVNVPDYGERDDLYAHCREVLGATSCSPDDVYYLRDEHRAAVAEWIAAHPVG